MEFGLYGNLDEAVKVHANPETAATMFEDKKPVAVFLRCKNCTVAQLDFTGRSIDSTENRLVACSTLLAFSKSVYQLLQEVEASSVEVAGYARVLVYSDGTDCNGTIYYFPDCRVYFVKFESFALVELGNCEVKLEQYCEGYIDRRVAEVIQSYLNSIERLFQIKSSRNDDDIRRLMRAAEGVTKSLRGFVDEFKKLVRSEISESKTEGQTTDRVEVFVVAENGAFFSQRLILERGIFNELKRLGDKYRIYIGCSRLKEILEKCYPYTDDTIEVAEAAAEEGVWIKGYELMSVEELKIEEAYGDLGDFLEDKGVKIDDVEFWVSEVMSVPYKERDYFILKDGKVAIVEVSEGSRKLYFERWIR